MAAVAMSAAGVSHALSIGSNHEGLRRVAPVFGAAVVPVPSRCRVQRRVSVQAIAEPPTKSTPQTIEECEADVVAGNVPAAPPVPAKAKAPEGTPRISPLVMPARPRRNRRSPALRAAFQETTVSPANFILPLFVHEGEQNAPIGAMPECQRLGWRHGLIDLVGFLQIRSK